MIEDFSEWSGVTPWISDTRVISVGHHPCSPGHGWGGQRPSAAFHLIVKGCGQVHIGQNQSHLQKGDGFLILPGVENRYQADTKDPWTYLWVRFSGSRPLAALRQSGIGRSPPVWRNLDLGLLLPAFNGLIQQFQGKSRGAPWVVEGLLWQFLGHLAERTAPSPKSPDPRAEKLMAWVEGNFHKPIQIADLANLVGLSRSWVTTCFTERVGMSLRDYLVDRRLKAATQMLSDSNKAVSEIAQAVGFRQYGTFSKLFQNRFGVSPSVWRGNAPRKT